MESTKRLRKWWATKFPVMDKQLHDEFSYLVDAIESEHKRAIAWVNDYDPETMEEAGWVRLPVDSEGVPIHVGDELEAENGKRFKARFLTLNDHQWLIDYSGWYPDKCRHHRTPTVEDVLREFAQEVEICGVDGSRRALEKCAAKLRLAGDE